MVPLIMYSLKIIRRFSTVTLRHLHEPLAHVRRTHWDVFVGRVRSMSMQNSHVCRRASYKVINDSMHGMFNVHLNRLEQAIYGQQLDLYNDALHTYLAAGSRCPLRFGYDCFQSRPLYTNTVQPSEPSAIGKMVYVRCECRSIETMCIPQRFSLSMPITDSNCQWISQNVFD